MVVPRPLHASLALVAVAAMAAPAVAQDDARPRDMQLELGIAAGLFIADDEHEFYDPQQGAQEPIASINPDVLARLGFYPVRFFGVEGEAGAVLTETDSGGSATLLAARASLVLQLPARLTPMLFGGVGNVWTRSSEDVLGDDRDRIWHVGAGLKYFLNPSVHLRLDGRWYYTNRLRDGLDDNGMVSHWEVTLGAGFHLGGDEEPVEPPADPDPDRDGFTGAADMCPDEPGVAPDGCPERDTDGDGIVDSADKCPDEPETRNGSADEDGCPDEEPDADGDGLVGEADKCPDEPEDKDGFKDEDGCPDPDNDDDGVLDASDACVDEAGVVENRGCPDADRDGDGVVDRVDNCPDEAGTAENQGCKQKQLVVITQTQLRILDTVLFASGRPTIQPRSRRLLDQVASVLNKQPDIKKVRIEGHTDDRGGDEFNQRLSERRAEAVRDYLIDRGVAPERLEAVGHGESNPIEDNGTARGRAANRRVEFTIVDPAPAAPAGGEAQPPPQP